MPYTQDTRQMQVVTPLGKDALLLVGFSGTEAISQLFRFQLSLLAENKTEVAFAKLLGQKVTVLFPKPDRHFCGIVSRISQGDRDQTFTGYSLEIVPQFWLLTRKAQSRIFQHLSVPDILKKVLAGLDVRYSIEGTFEPRDYCVQYRETDFNFASRLMEEEGIFYYFEHSANGHKLVVSNQQTHPTFQADRVSFTRTSPAESERRTASMTGPRFRSFVRAKSPCTTTVLNCPINMLKRTRRSKAR